MEAEKKQRELAKKQRQQALEESQLVEEKCQLVEQQRQQALEELKGAVNEKRILEKENQKAQKRIRMGTGIFAASLIAAAITGGLALKASQTLQEAREGTRLERQGLNAVRQFEMYPIDGLVSAMSAGQELKAWVKHKGFLPDYPTLTPMLTLHTMINQISEGNQLQHQDLVVSASFSPDGESILTASDDNTAQVRDRRGQMIAELKGHQEPVISASFSPDGESIVTASLDNTARVWDLRGQMIAELKGHQAPVNSASFSPDGESILTASSDNTARVWPVGSLDKLLE